MKRIPFLLVPLLSFWMVGLAHAQAIVPSLINYQAHVTNAAGVAVGTGTPVNRLVHFRFWNNPTASAVPANLLYSESATVTINAGDFSVLLGQGAEIATEPHPAFATIFNSAQVFLGITVDVGGDGIGNDSEIAPRQQLVTTAFAFRSKIAEGVDVNAITETMLATGAVTANKLATDAVTASQLAGDAVSGAKIVDSSIVAADLANNSVTRDKIIADAVTGAKIQDGSITANDLGASSVTTAKMTGGAVTTAILADGNVTTAKLADGSVTANKLADGSVTANKIPNSTINPSKLTVAMVSAGEDLRIVRGTVDFTSATPVFTTQGGSGFIAEARTDTSVGSRTYTKIYFYSGVFSGDPTVTYSWRAFAPSDVVSGYASGIAGPSHTSGNDTTTNLSPTKDGFTLWSYGGGGEPIYHRYPFHFIAIGPR